MKIYDDPDSLVTGIYDHLKDLFTSPLPDDPPVHIALAGGNTPRAFYDYLASRPEGEIRWNKIHLWWGDERCVPPGNSESNYRMVREKLLDRIDICARNVHRIRGEANPDSEALRYSKEIEENLPISSTGLPVFDLILLGIGEDGHTASIFPDSDFKNESTGYSMVTSHPKNGQSRITLTLPVLNQARRVIFMVSGGSKADMVEMIIGKQDEAIDLPAAKVFPEEGELIWFLDRDAAIHLNRQEKKSI